MFWCSFSFLFVDVCSAVPATVCFPQQAKLSLADPQVSASPHDPLLTYLTALYPDFAFAFSAWLHEKGATQIPTPPVQLNQRFYAITTFNSDR